MFRQKHMLVCLGFFLMTFQSLAGISHPAEPTVPDGFVLYDDFAGDILNGEKWVIWGDGHIVSQNERLQFDPDISPPPLQGGVETTQSFSGDFDFRVSWLNWSYTEDGSLDYAGDEPDQGELLEHGASLHCF